MPPSSVAGAVFLVAALSPGLIYHRVLARSLPRDSRSTVMEVVELATAGALTSSLAAVVVLGLGQIVPGLLSAAELVNDPAALRVAPWSVLASALLTLLLSFSLAGLSGWLWVRRSGAAATRIKEGSAWAAVLSAKRDGRSAFLAVELDDGRLVEGSFRTASVAEESSRDVLALRRPIAISGPGNEPRRVVDEDFVVIPRTIVKAIHGKYVSPTTVPAKQAN